MLAGSVYRFPGDERVLEQEDQAGGGGVRLAGTLGRGVAAEDVIESKSSDDSIEDGECSEPERVEGLADGMDRFAWSRFGGGVRRARSFSLRHEPWSRDGSTATASEAENRPRIGMFGVA
jgi:hypothetical protein